MAIRYRYGFRPGETPSKAKREHRVYHRDPNLSGWLIAVQQGTPLPDGYEPITRTEAVKRYGVNDVEWARGQTQDYRMRD